MNTTNTNESIEPKEKQKEVLFVADLEMRDYFAAKAMQSMLTAYEGIPYPMDNLSTRAYAQADSMLKAREQ